MLVASSGQKKGHVCMCIILGSEGGGGGGRAGARGSFSQNGKNNPYLKRKITKRWVTADLWTISGNWHATLCGIMH